MRYLLFGKINDNQTLRESIKAAFDKFSEQYGNEFGGDIIFLEVSWVHSDDRVDWSVLPNAIQIDALAIAGERAIYQNLVWAYEELPKTES